MKHLLLLLCLTAVMPVGAQTDAAGIEETFMQHDAAERDRIRQARADEQARVAAQEVACYKRFAVNDCLIDVRAKRREVLADLRRQEITLNDEQRKRRGAQQLLRSDNKAPVLP